MGYLIKDNNFFRLLRRKWISNDYFEFDLWMVVHFSSGVILSFFFTSWYIVGALLIAYEFFEFIVTGLLTKPETIQNLTWDIIFGMLGFFIGLYLL